MLVNSKYEGKKVIKRRGIAKELVIDDITSGTELVVDKDNGVLRLKKGKGMHLLLDRFAVVDNLKVDIFFVNGGMVVDLKKGMIIADLGDNKFAKVKKTGVTYITSEAEIQSLKSAKWVTYEGLFDIAKVLIGHKYRLGTEREKDMYVHNLAYNLLMGEGGRNVGEWGLTMQFVNFYTDLGLDSFEFAVGDYEPVVEKPKKQKFVKNKEEDEVEIDDDIVATLVGNSDMDEE